MSKKFQEIYDQSIKFAATDIIIEYNHKDILDQMASIIVNHLRNISVLCLHIFNHEQFLTLIYTNTQ